MVIKEQTRSKKNFRPIFENKFYIFSLFINIKNYKELDFLKKYIPPPNEIKTGNQAAKIGGNKPFTPNELNRNDIT